MGIIMTLVSRRATEGELLLAPATSKRKSVFWSIGSERRDQSLVVVGLVVLLGAAAAAAITISPSPVSHSAPARAAVEATTFLIAALAACLLCGRARAGRRGRDLMLAWGVGLFAVIEGSFSLLPAIVSREIDGNLLRAHAIALLLVAVVFAVAALAPLHVIDRAGRRSAHAMGASLIGLPLVLLVTDALSFVPAPAGLAVATPATGFMATDLAAALLAVVAGAVFAGRAIRDGTELQAWIAAALVLLGTAQLDAGVNVLTPEWMTMGEVLRSAAALALLAGALRQLGTYPSAAARRAVAQERRRIARDLHDGLAQELAYIAAHAPRVAAGSDDPAAARIAEAAACALDETRLAIASLAHTPGESLGSALTRTAERIASRAGGIVRIDLQEGVEVEAAVRSDLLRIVREATTNAVRHGGASEVLLTLTGGEAVVLRIADDGVGFRPDGAAAGSHSGFGLTSMQERAARAGGRLRVRSDPGRGTVVEVRIA
jgi:signal transduction histidine kinase